MQSNTIKKEKQGGIVSINIFKASEEKRDKLFSGAMAKAIAKSEENIKIVKFDNSLNN